MHCRSPVVSQMLQLLRCIRGDLLLSNVTFALCTIERKQAISHRGVQHSVRVNGLDLKVKRSDDKKNPSSHG